MILAMLSGHNRREEICRIRSYTDAGQNLSLTGPVAGGGKALPCSCLAPVVLKVNFYLC